MARHPNPKHPLRRWLMRGTVALLALAFVGATATWLTGLSDDRGPPKRQVARIALLPDTPPPPPPPPPERAPEPPKPEVKPPPEAAPKADDAPKEANEPLKMEGAAGDGPSAFAAGTVRNEYTGGVPSVGASQAATGADRAQERFYANSARQLLRDALERNFRSELDEATATFSLWIASDGSIRRFTLVPTGDARLDGELNAALDETSRSLRLPPPPTGVAGEVPMRFRLTVKPLG
jgi:outer membrane biosynthesis protein TonB